MEFIVVKRGIGWRLEELPLVICRVMRHASWETTRKHYAPGDVQKDAEVLRAALDGKDADTKKKKAD